MEVLYEDNHIIIVSKQSGEIVQGDKTGDTPLSDVVKDYIKRVHDKPGNVFLGVVHRLDRPVSGVVVFAKTSKALARLNAMFRDGEVHKTYWAIVQGRPPVMEDTLKGWITRNEKQNKSYMHQREVPGAKHAVLTYRMIAATERYALLGCPIKGDLKYGARRSNPDGSISLHARRVEFVHPVSKESIVVEAPVPNDNLWREITKTSPK